MQRDQRNRILKTLADLSTVVVVCLVFVLIYLLVHPFNRGFHCNDDTINYPYKGDTIPLWAAGVIGAGAAIVVIIFTELYINRPCCIDEKYFKRRHHKCHGAMAHALMIFIMGAAATLLITEIGKHTIGRLRPHFLTVCDPKWNQIQCYDTVLDKLGKEVKIAKYVEFDYSICSEKYDQKIIREARLSFPSGHSSFTVFSMVFIIIYLEERLHSPNIRYFKASIQLIAFIIAWFTCMSRVSDWKHHYTDVIAGAIIGFCVAVFSTLVMGKILWIYGFEDENDDEEDVEERVNNDENDIQI